MERFAHSRWPKGFGLLFASLLLLSMIAFDANDPTLTNLRYPSTGISNPLWLPGALLGGSLVEFFGASALWLPLLIAHRLLVDFGRGSFFRLLVYGTGLLLFSTAIHGLLAPYGMAAAPDGWPGPRAVLGLTSEGLAGLASARWVARTTGPWVGGAILGWGLGLCLWRLTSLYLLAGALRDARMIVFFLAGRVAARARHAGAATAMAAGAVAAGPWRERGRPAGSAGAIAGPGGTLLAALWRAVPIRPGRRPAALGVAAPTQTAPPPAPGSGPAAPGWAGRGKDDFDTWLAAIGEPPAADESLKKP